MATPDPSPADFEQAYQAAEPPPWDLGRPQPEIVALAEAGLIDTDVLDVGCGTGENALYLSSLGKRVMGVDASPTALARAQAKAQARGLPVAFRQGDALHLEKLRRRFECAIDCGLFHLFDRPTRRAYAHSLCEVLSPGSTLHLLCWSDEEPEGPGPNRLQEYDIREAFRSIFAMTAVRPARFELNGREPAKAWLATLTRI